MPPALALAAFLAAQGLASANPAPAPTLATSPATLPGAVQFDMASKITGRTYRIYVAKPLLPPPKAGYPAVYVLDADTAFPTAASQMTMGQLGGLRPGLIVGVAYPNAGPLETLKLRNRDLTPSQPNASTRAIAQAGAGGGGDYGDAVRFHRFLVEELRPAIETAYPTDPADRTLIGYSLGGLFALHVLFRHPGEFRTVVAGSPSIWWNDREVLADEAAFADAVRSGVAAPRVLITSDGLEQSPAGFVLPPSGPQREQGLQAIAAARMVDNARDLAARLNALKGGPTYVVRYTLFDGETHETGIPAATSRAIGFALEK